MSVSPKQFKRNSFPFNYQPYCSLIGQFYPHSPKPIGWRSCSLEWDECEKYELTSIQLPAELLKGVGRRYSIGYPYVWDPQYPGTSLIEVFYDLDIENPPRSPVALPSTSAWPEYTFSYRMPSSGIYFERNLSK